MDVCISCVILVRISIVTTVELIWRYNYTKCHLPRQKSSRIYSNSRKIIELKRSTLVAHCFQRWTAKLRLGTPFTFKPLKLKRKRRTPRRRKLAKKVRRKTGEGVKGEDVVQLFGSQPKLVVINNTPMGNINLLGWCPTGSVLNTLSIIWSPSLVSLSMVPISPQVA